MSDQQPTEETKPAEQPAQEAPAQEAPAEGDQKQEEPKPEADKPAEEAPKQEDAPKESEPEAKEEAKAEEAVAEPEKPAQEEPAKEEPAKEEAAKEEPAKEEPAKEEPAKEEPAKMEAAPAEESKEKPAEEAAAEEEGDQKLMGIDEFYPEGYVDKPIEDSSISRRNLEFYGVMGMTSTKRFNISFLEDDVIIFSVGNKYQTYNLTTKKFKTFHGQDTDGIGSIAVHPSRKYFAVAEKGTWPNIYIFEYPSFRLYRIMKKGTENLYAHCEFSNKGDKFVSLGGAPDYTITVWNWLAQRVILKAKASSQEVFRASFSPYSDDVLITGGSGHIKFWKMAQTFTGLKLQGEVAKFGQLELSDSPGFYELPDGKIVSGTEQGTMVLWEGVLVKAHLVQDRNKKTPLHEGAIEVILYEKEQFITAGADGYIKWWPLHDIDQAESDEVAEVAIQPNKEVSICTPDGEYAHIVNMVKGSGFWLVQDAKGHMWRLDCDDYRAEEVLGFHSGAITDMAVSDACNMAMTCGEDGMIKVWDYVRKNALFSRKFPGRANCCDLIRRSDSNKARVGAIGYENGIVRIVQLTEEAIELAHVFKVHDKPIVACRFSPSQTSMCAVSKCGDVFFFVIDGHGDLNKYEPNSLVCLPEGAIVNDMKWNSASSKVLLCCDNGYVYEVEKPAPEQVNNKETFLLEDWPIRSWKIKMMEFQMKKNQKKDPEEEERKRKLRLRGELKDEDEEEEDWDPDCIHKVCYMNDDSGRFLIGTQGQYAGYFYLCDFEEDRPVKAYEIPKEFKFSYLSFTHFGDLLICAYTNGDIRVLNIEYPDRWVNIKQHDGQEGSIASVKLSFDERFIVSAAYDGLILIHTLDKFMIQQESQFNPIKDVEGIDFMPEEQVKEITNNATKAFHDENAPKLPEIDAAIDGLEEGMFAIMLKMKAGAEDITDESQYSIQQAKLRTEEDIRLKLANEKKEGVRAKIEILREQFKALQDKNLTAEEALQVSEEDFNIDPEYFEMLLDQNAAKIEETKKEVAWKIEKATVSLDKLKNKFYNVLDFEKFTVKAIRTCSYVNTFRVPQMSEFLQKNIESFKSLLESEFAAKEGVDFDDEEEEEQQDAVKAKDNKIKVATTVSNIHKTDAEKKREERKIQREQRKKKIEKLTKKMQQSSGKNPEEQAAIEEAERTFGTYELKNDTDYQVPETMQVNFNKKRQQMVLLEGSIHKLKVDFNTKIGELKERKQEIISRVDVLNTRLGEINTELGTPEHLTLPQIDEALEYPQKFFDVSNQDIEDFRSLKIQREADALAEKKAGGKKKKMTEAEKEKEAQEKAAAEVAAAEAEKAARAEAERKRLLDWSTLNTVPRNTVKTQETTLDNEMRQILQIELEYEKEQIKNEIDTLINDFDTEIKEMQKEKYRLESDLKNADMKLILLFEELIILKQEEPKDQRLTRELGQCRQEKGMIMNQIQEITRKLKEKKKEIERMKLEEDALLSKFHSFCPEGNDKYEKIRKFYERITKRKRKPEKVEKEDGDEDEDEEEAEEEFEEEEEDDEEDVEIASLPQEEYKIDEIEKLREERMVLHDEKDKIQVYIAELEQQSKKLANSERNINDQLEETELEISDFQKEKLAKLNQLAVSVVLKVKQLQNLVEDREKVGQWMNIRQQELMDREQAIDDGLHDASMGGDDVDRQALKDEERRKAAEDDWRGYFLPSDVNDSVLFTRDQLLQLIKRKRELDIEIDQLKKEQQEAANLKRDKQRDIRQHKKLKEEAEREYNERQMLRFGNLVDLDSLEVQGPSQIVIDLTNKYNREEKRCIKNVEDADGEFERTQRELTSQVQKNTNLLNLIRQLGERQIYLNKELDSANKQIFVDEDNEKKRKMRDLKQEFKNKLEEQAKDIDLLKHEINLYKRKGGHIYTRVTTNRRVQNANDNQI